MRIFPLAVIFLVGTGAAAAAHSTVQISAQDCSRLTLHVASNDTNYRPGVDGDGNAVAPADLNGSGQIPASDAITFPLTLDLASRLGIPNEGDADYLAEPVIGEVVVTDDGRVTFNGTPLTDDAQFDLAQKCQRVDKAP